MWWRSPLVTLGSYCLIQRPGIVVIAAGFTSRLLVSTLLLHPSLSFALPADLQLLRLFVYFFVG